MKARLALGFVLGSLVIAGLYVALPRDAQAQTSSGTMTIYSFGAGAEDGDKGAVVGTPIIQGPSTSLAELVLTSIKTNPDASKTNYRCTIQFQSQSALLEFVRTVKAHTGTSTIGCGGKWTVVNIGLRQMTTTNWSLLLK